MADYNFTSAAMADLLKQKINKAKEQEEASKREIVTTEATPVVPEATVTVADPEPKKVQLGGKLIRGVRAKDNVSIYLSNLKTAASVESRVAAWQKIMSIFIKYPTKSVFDEIYEFFKTNKDEEFLSEAVALQGITSLDMSVHQRVRILYMTMRMMSTMLRKDARNKIGVNVLRNIFGNDNFSNWVSSTLNPR